MAEKPHSTGLAGTEKRRRRRRVSVLRRKARTKDLMLLTGLLRQLAACRAPMVEGLLRSAADCANNQVSMHLYRLAEHMQAGESLSGAMRQSPKFFPRYYVDLVEVAEVSNQLETTLSGLMYEVESRHQAGHTARNRAAYIAILLGFVVFVSSLLAAQSIPVVEDTTRSFGGQTQGIPDFGKTVMGCTGLLSGALQELGDRPVQMLIKAINGNDWNSLYSGSFLPPTVFALLLGGGLVAVLFVAASLLLFLPGRYLFSRLPWVRRIMLHAQWGHALRILSLLLARGVTLDRALDSAAGADVNARIRSTLRRLSDHVRSGHTLSNALKKERGRAPRSLRTAVAFGEQAGCLPESLSRLSHAYRLRAERAARMLANLLFPLAIVGCGVLVLSVHARLFGLLCITMDTIANQM